MPSLAEIKQALRQHEANVYGGAKLRLTRHFLNDLTKQSDQSELKGGSKVDNLVGGNFLARLFRRRKRPKPPTPPPRIGKPKSVSRPPSTGEEVAIGSQLLPDNSDDPEITAMMSDEEYVNHLIRVAAKQEGSPESLVRGQARREIEALIQEKLAKIAAFEREVAIKAKHAEMASGEVAYYRSILSYLK